MNGVMLIICAVGSVLGLLLAMALLWRNQQSRGNIVLATMVFLAAVDVFLAFVKWALFDNVASVAGVPVYISLLVAPLLLQTLNTPTEEMPFANRWQLHLGLFATVQSLAMLEIWETSTWLWLVFHELMATFVAVVLSLYMTKCIRSLYTSTMVEAGWPEFHSSNIAKVCVISIAVCQLLGAIASVLFSAPIATTITSGLYGVMALMLVVLVYSFLCETFANEDVASVAETSKEKYGNNRLPEFVRESIIRSLENHMHSDKPWLKIDLTLAQLAGSINVNPHHLSQIINSHFGKSFACFINEYRVEAACQLLATNSNKTVLEIALDSGFSSKSSFNTLFKKQTGFTPSEYRKKFQTAPCAAA